MDTLVCFDVVTESATFARIEIKLDTPVLLGDRDPPLTHHL